MMLSEKIKNIMETNVITVESDEDVVFAFEKLMKNKISAMPVMEDGNMVGIITATDLGHNLILDKYELGTPVNAVMVKNVISITSDKTLADAVKVMKDSVPNDDIINQLPVVDDGNLIGIISDGDIIKAIS
ncbi:CBS domain-containing protein [Methanobrevibacter sp. OttesenSCG-928-K11]|nr:CBS domain-containing protein [Methanobrevibacter sp. OttesenSCG-928-K11]MDL2271152.1 CBS domain-containing protein [Methanobrevibacter sp. OttesenSCG-928-I08]